MHTKNVLPIAVSSVPEHVILTPLEPSGSEERCYTICWAAHHSKQGTSKDAGNNEGQEPQKPKLGAPWLLQSPEWDPSRQGTGETTSEHPAHWGGLVPTGMQGKRACLDMGKTYNGSFNGISGTYLNLRGMTKGRLGKDWSGSGNTQTSGACRTRYQQFRQRRRSGAGTRYLTSLDRASESSSWNNWSVVCVVFYWWTRVLMSWRGRAGGAVQSVWKLCVFMGCGKGSALTVWVHVPAGIRGRTSAASQLWACNGRIFPGSWSPQEPSAFHRSTAAPTFKLCLHLILVLNKQTSDLISTARAVPGPRICSYQAGSSSPWELSSCELWMHRVCLQPSESGPAPWPGSHTHLSDSFWQHPLLTSSPSPLPSGYLEHRKTQ